MPEITKQQLINKIENLATGSKSSLYFLYSEFLLRANRNPFYKQVLNKADLIAVDGKGNLWAQGRLKSDSFLVKTFAKTLNYNFFIRSIIFLVLFTIQLLINIFLVAKALFSKQDLSQKAGTELILGRDFVYNLLDLAQKNNWKVAIIGSGRSTEIKQNLEVKFPSLTVSVLALDSQSDLMRDKTKFDSGRGVNLYKFFIGIFEYFLIKFKLKKDYTQSNFKPKASQIYTEHPASFNLTTIFPEIDSAVSFLEKDHFDVVLVCLGGKSGKQEFFIDLIKNNPKINFRLATGIGAALDHLGGGRQQTIAPQWMLNFGLEWLHRFLTQPYRRVRILDSIWTLIWWTTLQQFIQVCGSRKTAINIVKNSLNEFLLAKRREGFITGDIGWAWFQGGVDAKDEQDEAYKNFEKFDLKDYLKEQLSEQDKTIIQAGVRELCEETNLLPEYLQLAALPVKSQIETMNISFKRFVLLGCQYYKQEKYINFLTLKPAYQDLQITVDWENKQAGWFRQESLSFWLVPEKLEDFKLATK